MSSADRLSSQAPGIVQLLVEQTQETQRSLAARLATYAIDHVGVADTRVSNALAALHTGEFGVSVLRSDLDALVRELDDQAWNYQEEGNEDLYSTTFDKARAVNAVWFALSTDSAEAVLESAYETLMALDGDVSRLDDLVRSEIDRS